MWSMTARNFPRETGDWRCVGIIVLRDDDAGYRTRDILRII